MRDEDSRDAHKFDKSNYITPHEYRNTTGNAPLRKLYSCTILFELLVGRGEVALHLDVTYKTFLVH
jgi:hypothetical protein